MSRKTIGSIWNRDNRANIEHNFEELYGELPKIEGRLLEQTWERTKESNTIKMLEPVETFNQLPDNAKIRSLVAVLDEQTVYTFTESGWQPFNKIDLDPFSPFKKELEDLISEYNSRAESILSNAEESNSSTLGRLQSLTEEFNEQYQNKARELENLADSGVAKIDEAKAAAIEEFEAVKGSDTDEWQKSKLTLDNGTTLYRANVDFNNPDDTLTGTGFYYVVGTNLPVGVNRYGFVVMIKRSDSTARLSYHPYNSTDVYVKLKPANSTWGEWQKAAITPKDAEEWQKHKLTDEEGGIATFSQVDLADTTYLDGLKTGFYYLTNTQNIPAGATSRSGFLSVFIRESEVVKRFEYRPYNSGQIFYRYFYNDWQEWIPADGTQVELFKGSVSTENATINLSDDPQKYSYLIIYINHFGGDDTVLVGIIKDYFVICSFNLGNNGRGASLIETSVDIDGNNPKKLILRDSIRVESDTATGQNYVPKILKIVGVK
ncbi:pyocin knob domain-containing protein [Staphylococcus felis]|uniref:Uncharacterized protein n=1 Tax=Staphylococcus felis TaxID=46127 RepID=A0ABS0QLN8_9STAP|nr:pyocin knob domain-containing protein [Staphylococcus felis]MBH9580135.1 hypothetical protein [Staphylococcus felis]